MIERVQDLLGTDEARAWQAFYPQACTDRDTLGAVLEAIEQAGPLTRRQQLLAASFSLLATSFQPRYLAAMRRAIDADLPEGDVQCALLQMLLQIALNNYCTDHRQAVAWRQETCIDSLYRAQAAAARQRMADWPAWQPPQAGTGRRVLIIASNLSVLVHPPSRLVLEHAKALRDSGHSVRIISLNDELSTEIARHSGAPLPLARAPNVRVEWQRALGHELKVWAARPDDSFEARWQMLSQVMQQHRADVVLYVGIGSAVMHMLYERVPLISLCTSGYPLEAPADVELLSSPHLWPERRQALEYAFRARIDPGLLSAPSRDLPGARGSLRLVSVGNRLANEITGPWAERMMQMLQERPDVHWLLIGDARMPEALGPVKRQVTALPHVDGLGGIYRAADVYVNPPRLGGGLSVMEAMACGLPVVALEGGDGGDKLGNDAATGREEYFTQLATLIQSPERRAAAASRQQVRCSEALDLAAAGPALNSAIDLAIGRFRNRAA